MRKIAVTLEGSEVEEAPSFCLELLLCLATCYCRGFSRLGKKALRAV
jgi:hypothetical protein